MTQQQKKKYSDEELMAFADGEADDALTLEITTAIESDNALARRVELFMSTSQSLKRAFPPLPDNMADQKIVAAMQAAMRGESNGMSPSSNIMQFPVKRRPILDTWWQGAAAAAVVLGIGLATGNFMAQKPSPTSLLAAVIEPAERDAFQNKASGEAVDVPAGKLTLIATFEAADGEVCREYEIETQQPRKVTGLACKRADGWHTVAQIFSDIGDKSFAPASGVEFLDSFVERAQLKGPLTAEEEKAALTR